VRATFICWKIRKSTLFFIENSINLILHLRFVLYCITFNIIVSVLSLQELCCRAIVPRTTVYGIEQLPLPPPIKSHLKSYAMTSYTARYVAGTLLRPSTTSHKKPKLIVPTDATRSSCVGRNSCLIS
jgi:SOCS box